MSYIRWVIYTLSLSCIAQAFAEHAPDRNNQTGLFLGLGGSYSSIHHYSNTAGTLNATQGFPPLGIFAGGNQSYSFNQQALSPQLELGYLHPLKKSNWLAGVAFMYSRVSNTVSNPEAGTGAPIDLTNPVENVTDQLKINYSPTKINDKLLLPVFVGHSFLNSFIYLGAGPALLRINNAATYSDALSGYYVGDVTKRSNTRWISGGELQTGLAYYFNPSWFFKLNYTYAKTSHYTINSLENFSPAANNGLNSGLFSLSTNHHTSTQDLAFSINKVFSL